MCKVLFIRYMSRVLVDVLFYRMWDIQLRILRGKFEMRGLGLRSEI